MLETLARNKKSVYGNGPATAASDPLPDFDRWREYLERDHVQPIMPPPGSTLPDQDDWENVKSRQDIRARKREEKAA
eukprot:791482-Alexandrium_andersonii.AAC.1